LSEDDAVLTPDEARAFAARDLRGALGWVVFGVAVLVLSLRMDRLEAQHINPYTIPGLLPALLGIVILGLGVLLALRSWRRGGRLLGGPQLATSAVTVRRLALVIGLIVVYTVVLLGRGLPFWLGATLYVVASILLLQAPQRAAEGRGVSVRDVTVAVAIGLASGWVITIVFQDAFLVRLP
jgi:hypothetical protein